MKREEREENSERERERSAGSEADKSHAARGELEGALSLGPVRRGPPRDASQPSQRQGAPLAPQFAAVRTHAAPLIALARGEARQPPHGSSHSRTAADPVEPQCSRWKPEELQAPSHMTPFQRTHAAKHHSPAASEIKERMKCFGAKRKTDQFKSMETSTKDVEHCF